MTDRLPAVAGTFYPASEQALDQLVSEQLGAAPEPARCPVGLIVPHAGLIYSGSTAAKAYRQLMPHRSGLSRVALFGPSHRVPLEGMAVPSVDAFVTPLGRIQLDRDALDALVQQSTVSRSDMAHAQEHSLEVQLPFLQRVLGEFQLVPVVVGWSDPAAVAHLMSHLLRPGTLLVVSSDLSHFHDYRTAQAIDQETTNRILAREGGLAGDQACGCHAVNGLLHLAREHDWRVEQIHRCNSGDTAGPRDRVVGYGAFGLYEPE